MRELLPLRERGADAFERSLLEVGAREAPSAAARVRMRAAVGTGAALATWTATAEGAAGVEVIQAPAAASSGFLGLSLAKWIGIGIVAGAITAGVAHQLRSVSPTVPRPAEPVRLAQQSTALPVEPASPPQSPAAEPPTQRAANSKSTAVGSGSARRAEQGGITRELQLLEEARTALASGDTARSAALLAEHRRFPKRALGPEAQILSIQVALAQGRRAEAARMAEAFLEARPRSPHARRVRSLLQAAQGKRAEQTTRSEDHVGAAEQRP